jgi:hypothetical protein
MSRRLGLALGLAAAFLFATGCGDDTTNNNTKLDKGVKKDKGGGGTEATVGGEPQTGGEPTSPGAEPGSSTGTFGKVCTSSTSVCGSDAPDCIGLTGGSGVYFCTKTCSTIGDKCTGAPTGMYGMCLLGQTMDSGKDVYSCGFVCQIGSSTTYTCPTGMKCTKVNYDSGSVAYGYCE